MILFRVITWTGNSRNIVCELIFILSYNNESPSSGPSYDHLYYPKPLLQLSNHPPKGLYNSPVSIPIFVSSSNPLTLKMHYDTKHIYNIVINIWKNRFCSMINNYQTHACCWYCTLNPGLWCSSIHCPFGVPEWNSIVTRGPLQLGLLYVQQRKL